MLAIFGQIKSSKKNFFEFGIYERRNETLVFNDNYVMIISVSIAFLSL